MYQYSFITPSRGRIKLFQKLIDSIEINTKWLNRIEIVVLIDNDDFQREEPRFFNCIYEINDEFIEYYPHPGQSDDSKFLKRKDFDSRLSRLRKRFR